MKIQEIFWLFTFLESEMFQELIKREGTKNIPTHAGLQLS